MTKRAQKEYSTSEMINIVFVILGALIPILYTFNVITKSYGIILFSDETGYWADAMTFAGRDWSGISQMFPWYSYGYSALLVPLIAVFKNPTVLYRAALILNVLMIEIVYGLWIRIIGQVDKKISLGMRAVIAASMICYPTYILYSNIALPEICLLLVFTVICFFLVKASLKVTIANSAILGMLAIALYAVHNRNIGVVIALILAVGILVFKSENRIKAGITFATALVISFVIYTLIKNNLQSKLWPVAMRSANEASDQGGKFDFVFASFDNFMLLVKVFFAQLGSVAISTLGIAMLGIYGLISRIVCAIKSKNNEWVVPAFIVSAFILSLGISSLFLIDFTRADQIVYTRYVDTIVSALIIAGFLYLRKVKEIKAMVISLVVAVAPMIIGMACAKSALKARPSINYLNAVNCPGLTRWYLISNLDFMSYLLIPVTIAVLMLVCLYLIKTKRDIVLSSIAVVIIAIMAYTSVPLTDWVLARQELYSAQNEALSDISASDVYYYASSNGEFVMYAQYRLNDKTFHVVNSIDEVPDGACVLWDVPFE